jgi:hypothetical protein
MHGTIRDILREHKHALASEHTWALRQVICSNEPMQVGEIPTTS